MTGALHTHPLSLGCVVIPRSRSRHGLIPVHFSRTRAQHASPARRSFRAAGGSFRSRSRPRASSATHHRPCHVHTVVLARDASEGKAPQGRPKERLNQRLEEVAKAVGGGYCRLQMPLRLALSVRGTVAGPPPPPNASLGLAHAKHQAQSSSQHQAPPQATPAKLHRYRGPMFTPPPPFWEAGPQECSAPSGPCSAVPVHEEEGHPPGANPLHIPRTGPTPAPTRFLRCVWEELTGPHRPLRWMPVIPAVHPPVPARREENCFAGRGWHGSPFAQTPAPPPWSPCREGGLGWRCPTCHAGGGGGPTPTYMAQNDPRVALIILTTHMRGEIFS